MNPDNLVQPIVVLPSNHFETIAAAALASALACAGADRSGAPWSDWLSAGFTKSVRRAKRPADLDRVRAVALTRTEIGVGEAVAMAFAPIVYADSPPPISRLQVSGLDLAREQTTFTLPGAIVPQVQINATVAMTTGKTAAQVAHALGVWVLTMPSELVHSWVENPGLELVTCPFSGDTGEPGSWAVVRDNGLTEIPAGTATVRVGLQF
ncbi:Peptidyl-tRNA hydrolase [Plantibacter flavus]|uniref:Peptidyl-tRNA hydrolase n=1 Tax=Plantibacter flavus TaxID=150123 RepID=A0A3N2BL95_9MICO|nr:hypothetical protein [Plantibacter flavus]ROR76040.1 peptidyl-tRNA hydrolase [Plantibacter flavus]SMG49042.1 Peptidyl-tRNA hydrolase [Plantibacter flavus]